MTPKEKANDLIVSFIIKTNLQGWSEYVSQVAKQCALIAVDEMLSHTMNCDYGCAGHSHEFWNEVKNEIELL